MFTAFIYTNGQVTFVQTNFLYHILNRQTATESATGTKLPLKPIEHLYWPVVFFLDLNAMFTAFLNHILYRQPATESATGI